VSWDYPGERPWAFARGTIERVIVKVSGEPYFDLEKEAMAVLSRERGWSDA
jgi:arylsulfatase